jgi:hypothetical protein
VTIFSKGGSSRRFVYKVAFTRNKPVSVGGTAVFLLNAFSFFIVLFILLFNSDFLMENPGGARGETLG